MRQLLCVLALVTLTGCSNRQVDACKAAVELHLKSPASAQWGSFETDQGARETDVRGQVDSDNAFGASRRTYFVCRFKEGERVKVALGDRPFDDLKTRLRNGTPILDWQ